MAARRSAIKLYRLLIQATSDLHGLRGPPNGLPWGTYNTSAPVGVAYQQRLIQRLFPAYAQQKVVDELLGPQVYRHLLREQFKKHAGETRPEAAAARLDEAFQALRIFTQQQYLQASSSTSSQDGVCVEVVSAFDKVAALGSGISRYIFSYVVRIINNRELPIQVLGRAWTIENEHGSIIAQIPLAEDNAVVGQQPIIGGQSGKCFEYASGTDCNTPSGVQSGAIAVKLFVAEGEPGATITVPIAPFQLKAPVSALRRDG